MSTANSNSIQALDKESFVRSIMDWLSQHPGCCLAHGTPYAAGYRDGFLQAVGILKEMMEECMTNDNESTNS